MSYASFPITETEKTEVIANIEVPNYRDSKPIWGILSLTFLLISLILIPNLLIMLIPLLLGIISGAIGFNKKLKGLAITGFILNLLIFILTIFLTAFLITFGGMGIGMAG